MSNSLQDKMFSGMTWTFIRQFSFQGFAFIQGIILARIIAPSDYGIIAMTTFFFAITGCFIDSGFATALIQKKGRNPIDYSTVFVTNVGITLFFACVLCVCSPLIANFYNEPILIKIVCANAILLFLNSFFSIQNTKLSIDLDFKAQNLIRLITNVIVGITSIIMALSGFGIWSLVWPNFLQPVIAGYLFWHHSHWFPGIKFSSKSFKEFWKFGSKLLVSNLINTIYSNIYPLIIGKKFSASALGFYSRAQGYASLPTYTLQTVLGPVAFPVLSTIQDDSYRLQEAYRKLIRASAYLVFPIMIGLAILAKPSIIVLITDKWLPAVEYLQILCFALMLEPLQMLSLDLIKVKGRSDITLRLEIIKKTIGFIILFASIPFGLYYMCLGQVFASVTCFILNNIFIGKLINVRFYTLISDIIPSAIYSIIMGLFVFSTTLCIDSYGLQLLAGIVGGGIVYIGISLITKSIELKFLRSIIQENIISRFNTTQK